MGQGIGSELPADKHRFLLELWLEPREIAARILRLRGRMHDLNTDGQRSVAGIADVDSFIHESFAAERDEPIGWETEP